MAKRIIEVETVGRRDLDDFFRLSDVLTCRTLKHCPILAFVAQDDRVEVRILSNAEDAASLPSDTPLMAQWRGQWSSDFFRFTAGELRAAYVRAA